MAIWQFGFYLVPSTAVIIDGAVAARMERDFLSTQLKFCGPIVGALAARVSNMFPEGQSWAPDLRVWGDVDANDHAVSSTSPQTRKSGAQDCPSGNIMLT